MASFIGFAMLYANALYAEDPPSLTSIPRLEPIEVATIKVKGLQTEYQTCAQTIAFKYRRPDAEKTVIGNALAGCDDYLKEIANIMRTDVKLDERSISQITANSIIWATEAVKKELADERRLQK